MFWVKKMVMKDKKLTLEWMDRMRELELKDFSDWGKWKKLYDYGLAEEKRITQEHEGKKEQ